MIKVIAVYIDENDQEWREDLGKFPPSEIPHVVEMVERYGIEFENFDPMRGMVFAHYRTVENAFVIRVTHEE